MSLFFLVVLFIATMAAIVRGATQRTGCLDCVRPGFVWCAADCPGTSSTTFSARICVPGTCAGQVRFDTLKASTRAQCDRELSNVDENGECSRADFSDADDLAQAANVTGRIIGSLSGVFCCLCIMALIFMALRRRQHDTTRIVHVQQQPQYVVVGPNGQFTPVPAPQAHSPGGHPSYPGNSGGQQQPQPQFIQQVPAAYPYGQTAAGAPVMTVSPSMPDSAAPTTPYIAPSASAPSLHPYGVVPDVTAPSAVLHYDGAQPIHGNSNYNQRPVGK
jgi:hypothetical protein